MGWLEIARDITERKRLEVHLRERQKLESVGILAGGIAHDFNNILTGILGNISLALEMTEPASPIRDLLLYASDASEKAALLIKQMLAYAGKGQFVVQAVDLSTVVRSALKLIRGSIPDNVHMRLTLADSLPSVQADETQLEQVAMNLLLNAVEAIGTNPGAIEVRTGIQEIDSDKAGGVYDVGSPAPGANVVLEVNDTGIGIDPSILPNIFDPFFTTKFPGRGLGLAAVSGIMRTLKGAVKVDSTPGQGTNVRILLPAGGVRLQAGASLKKSFDAVLVVDDEEIVRRTAEAILRNHGFQVMLAENGQQAVELFGKFQGRIALVLLDRTMPVMNGEETLRQLKAIRSDVPVVVSSGYREEEALLRFGGLDVAGFIQKPYTVRSLIEKIGRVLKTSNLP
jgi:nitrogen-specific signal transduction histidine kinase/CheY-like chemotaxis protein